MLELGLSLAKCKKKIKKCKKIKRGEVKPKCKIGRPKNARNKRVQKRGLKAPKATKTKMAYNNKNIINYYFKIKVFKKIWKMHQHVFYHTTFFQRRCLDLMF